MMHLSQPPQVSNLYLLSCQLSGRGVGRAEGKSEADRLSGEGGGRAEGKSEVERLTEESHKSDVWNSVNLKFIYHQNNKRSNLHLDICGL